MIFKAVNFIRFVFFSKTAMDVKIMFNTERDSVEDLKKLVKYLQELIAKKESQGHESYSSIENSESKNPEKTEGGCSIVPFQDMTETMEKIFSGKKDF